MPKRKSIITLRPNTFIEWPLSRDKHYSIGTNLLFQVGESFMWSTPSGKAEMVVTAVLPDQKAVIARVA